MFYGRKMLRKVRKLTPSSQIPTTSLLQIAAVSRYYLIINYYFFILIFSSILTSHTQLAQCWVIVLAAYPLTLSYSFSGVRMPLCQRSVTPISPPPPASRPQVKSVGQYVKSSKNVKKRQLVMKFARNLLQMRKDDQMQLAVRARSDQRRSSGGCRDWARAGGESSLRSPPLGTVGQAW